MNWPAASCGVSGHRDENFTPCVTPECFYRGSTLLTTTLSKPSKGRGSSSGLAWIPSATVLWRNAGMTDFGAGIRSEPRGMTPTEIKIFVSNISFYRLALWNSRAEESHTFNLGNTIFIHIGGQSEAYWPAFALPSGGHESRLFNRRVV